MKKHVWLIALLVTGCARDLGQNHYNYKEVGQSTIMEYATVIRVKQVDITGRNTGAGAAAGATAGGVTGYQMGNGNGQIATTVGGILLGAAAGHIAEQAMADHKGYEYTVVTEHKKTKVIVQNQNQEDRVFAKGDSVMVQTTGTYQRVLPADDIPSEVKRPKGIKITD